MLYFCNLRAENRSPGARVQNYNYTILNRQAGFVFNGSLPCWGGGGGYVMSQARRPSVLLVQGPLVLK